MSGSAPQFAQLVLDVLFVFGGDAGVDGDLGFVVWLGLWLVVRQEKT